MEVPRCRLLYRVYCRRYPKDLLSFPTRRSSDLVPVDDETIAEIETALHALARRLKQARLHEFVLKQAGVDIDQAGLAILYALHAEKVSLRVTDLADRLGIDAPAVTRKAQRLERLGLVSRARDVEDARASR